MKLSAKTLKKLIRGACYFEEKNGYTYPYHHTEAQIEHFRKRLDFWYERSILQAGIKIELVTDSEKMELDYFAPSCYSGSDTVDMYVDGLAMGVHYIAEGRGKASFDLPKGKKSVTLYLPIDTVIGVKSLTLDGKWRAAKPRKRRLLAIGDSITQGYGAKLAGSTYINSLYRKTDFEILSQGIGGFRYEKGSIMPIDNFKPDRILVALGTNYHEDMTYDYEKCIEEFYESLYDTYGDTPVISVTPIYRFDPTHNPERLKAVTEKIKDVCSKYPHIKVIDGLTLVPHIAECFIDYVHPNAYGSELMAEGIYSFMKKIKF